MAPAAAPRRNDRREIKDSVSREPRSGPPLLYYTRAVASRRIQGIRACLVAMALGSVPLSARQQLPGELAAAAGAVDRAADYVTVRERYESPDRPPLELIITAKAGAADRVPLLADGARRALATLDDWLGPLEADHLTIVDVPWNSRLVDHDHGDSVIVRSRWLTTSRDRSLERQLIADIARQYWR
jgi:hypothetical protein